MGILLSDQNLHLFFSQLLQGMSCREITRAYLINLYTTFQSSNYDLCKNNIGLLFLEAKNSNTFVDFQNIGDYIFFIQTIMPSHLQPISYYQDTARLSYYSCYRLINKQWDVYNELSDNLIVLEQQVIQKLSHIQIK